MKTVSNTVDVDSHATIYIDAKNREIVADRLGSDRQYVYAKSNTGGEFESFDLILKEDQERADWMESGGFFEHGFILRWNGMKRIVAGDAAIVGIPKDVHGNFEGNADTTIKLSDVIESSVHVPGKICIEWI